MLLYSGDDSHSVFKMLVATVFALNHQTCPKCDPALQNVPTGLTLQHVSSDTNRWIVSYSCYSATTRGGPFGRKVTNQNDCE